ncbi:MAG: flagellar hook-associated protein FlgK [Roseinatronobacter sp.]
MTLSLALSAAISGLSATSRATQVVSENIANQNAEGFAPREIRNSMNQLGDNGSGVLSSHLTRRVNERLEADLRTAMSRNEHATTVLGAWRSIETQLGAPDQRGSLSNLFIEFQASLHEAFQNPESPVRLSNIAHAASDLAGKINKVSYHISDLASASQESLNRELALINSTLVDIDILNKRIIKATAQGHSTASLEDMRDKSINDIARLIPVTQFCDSSNTVILHGPNGEVLLGQKPARLTLVEPDNQLTPEAQRFTIAIDDRPIHHNAILLQSGSTGGHMNVLNVVAREVTNELESLASRLAEVFSGPDADPTLEAGQFGLFVRPDLSPEGEATTPTLLLVNPLIDPFQAAQFWRLRDGMQAEEPGPNLISEQLRRSLSRLDPSLSDTPTTGLQDRIIDRVIDFSSGISSARLNSEGRMSSTSNYLSIVTSQRDALGVDIDLEMTRLLELERSYAANAKVISVSEEMFKSLIRI